MDKFIETERSSYDSDYFNCHEDFITFVFEGDRIVARLIKIITTYPEETRREFPKFWKTYKYQRNKNISYSLRIRTKEESKEHMETNIFADTDEEAVKKAFDFMDRRKYY
jgi:hypothetical protein